MKWRKEHLVKWMVFALIGVRFAVSAAEEMILEESDVEFSAALLWESRYVSEGRDNLEDGGLVSAEAGIDYKGLVAGVWYGLADTVSYDELNLFLEYGFELGDFQIYGGYTRLEFLKDDGYDNELSAGIAYASIPWLVPAVDYVYSTEAQDGDGGSFVELSLTAPFELFDGRLLLGPYLLEGFDFGYASDSYDGFNNFQFGTCVHYRLTGNLELMGTVNHSIANQDVRRDGGGDKTWFSMGVAATF